MEDMVAAQVKALMTVEHEPLESLTLKDPECFDVVVRAMVGPLGQEGEESFDVRVCTPESLAQICEKDGFVFGRHRLVVNSYSPAKIRSVLTKFIERCSGDSWQEVAEKVSRIGLWEFEDYRKQAERR